MMDKGMISQAEHDAAEAEEIHVYPVEDVFHEFAPYFVETVRKDVVERYGNPALLRDGLKVFTTMDSEKQRAAQEAMLGGLLAGGQAAGLPRPGDDTCDTPEQRKAFIDRSEKALGRRAAIENNRYYVGAGHRRRRTARGPTSRSARTRACSRCSACAGRAR